MGKRVVTKEEREKSFFERVKKLENGCWEWQGKLSRGYGNFLSTQAHRWAYEHFIGPIPKGLEIDHVCRNKACVNPDPNHLEPVTSQENIIRARKFKMQNFPKTHCPEGHEYNEINTYTRITSSGVIARTCKTCRVNKYYQKRLAGKKYNGVNKNRTVRISLFN